MRSCLVTDDYFDCVRSLQASNYEDYRDQLWYKRHGNTCSWLLQDKRFEMWKIDENRTVLWIDGDPGCGKSVMSSFLSKELEILCRTGLKSTHHSSAYFFCDDKDDRLRTACSVLANWLTQLLLQLPSIIAHFSAEPKFKTQKGTTSWTYDMLWRVFQRIVSDSGAGKIYLLVDALGMSP